MRALARIAWRAALPLWHEIAEDHDAALGQRRGEDLGGTLMGPSMTQGALIRRSWSSNGREAPLRGGLGLSVPSHAAAPPRVRARQRPPYLFLLRFGLRPRWRAICRRRSETTL